MGGQCELTTGQFTTGKMANCAPGLDIAAELRKANPKCWTCGDYSAGGNSPWVYAAGHENWHYQGCGLSLLIKGLGESPHYNKDQIKQRGAPEREFGQHNNPNNKCACQGYTSLNH